jgi:hypothetical protein
MRCGVRVPDRKTGWVTAPRKFYDRSPIKSGDYVCLKQPVSGRLRSQLRFRLTGIEIDECAGHAEDNPIYWLDISKVELGLQGYSVLREHFEPAGRPYLES